MHRSFAGRMKPAVDGNRLRNVKKVIAGVELRHLVFDVALAGLVLFLGLKGTIEIGSLSEAAFSRPVDGWHIMFIGLMALPLAVRRIFPTWVFVTILSAWIVDRGLDYPETPASIAVGIAFYTIGAELDRRRSLIIGGISSGILVLWTGIGAAILESVTSVALITTTIVTITPLLLGRERQARKQRVEDLRLRAERAEREREQKAQQAVAEERARIARELHDVVAHQMTVMTLQAEGAKRLATDADPRLADALDTIRTAGHGALAELRRTVGLLRYTDDDADTEPLPSLADLDRLIDQMRSAGVSVEVQVTGEPQDLSDGAELSAYRIVQESLTNAVRHGGPNVNATVTIDYGDEIVQVAVSDDGRGASSASDDESGHGLIGMRERIAVLGGEFEAGPQPGGGYRVEARIPVES